MEVYLVRHTETVCEKGICYGQSDVMIREPYKLVFETILKQLPQEAILYSSPLQRCRILAKYIQKTTKIDAFFEDCRIMEMNFGDWELKKWNDIPSTILDPWMKDFVETCVPNGESFLDLERRVWNFISEIATIKHSKPIIIVTHSGVIRSILCKVNKIPLQDAFKKEIDYGVVIQLII